MRKINATITIVLAVAAVGVWADVYHRSITLVVGGGYSSHEYPALCAITLSACACLGWVLVTVAAGRGDGETRCRKCRHILRGISEPRCPECGTHI